MASRSKTEIDNQVDLFSMTTREQAAPRVQIQSPVEVKPPEPKILSVTEFSTALKDSLRTSFPEVCIQGEICDFKGVHRNGHLYMGLKDDKSQVRIVMWRDALAKVPFEVRGGLEVILTGRVDYYSGSGSLQLVATRLEPVGIGALQLKFEQLKEKLRLEGLFDAARKRKVSPVNWRIGLVTGRSTAALQDMLKIFRVKFPLAEVFLFHASVQGEKAPPEIISAIARANRYSATGAKPLDVLIVGRGGGSYEDLFCFNDEGVVRAIAASKVPVVSAVGHEIDITIADMVADVRAATPTHAAQTTVPDRALWMERLDELERRFSRRMMDVVETLRQRLDHMLTRMTAASPQARLELQRRSLTERETKLKVLLERALERRRTTLSRLSGVLDALSPLKVLERGFSVVEGPRGLARRIRDVETGDRVKLRLTDGFVTADVVGVESTP